MEAFAEPTAPAHVVGSGSGSGGRPESSFDGGVSLGATAPASMAAAPLSGAAAHTTTDVVVAGMAAAEAAPDVAGAQPPRSRALLRELISGGPGTPSSLARRASGMRHATATTEAGGGTRPVVEGREEEQIRQDVRLFVQRLRNILPFVVLYMLHYLYAHLAEIAFVACYTLLLHKLNQELRTQISLKQDQDRKVLTSIIISSLAAVGAALLLDRQAATMQHPLFLSFSSMAGATSSLDAAASAGAAAATAATEATAEAAVDTAADAVAATAAAGAATDDGAGFDGIGPEVLVGGMSIEDMIWKILAADVCVRLFATAIKAIVVLVPWPLPHWRPTLALSPRVSGPLFRWLSIFGGKGPQGKKGGHHHHHHRVHSAGSARAGLSGRVSGDMEDLLAEVEMSISGSGHINGSGGGGGSGGGSGGGAHSPSRSLGSSSSSSSSVGRRVLAARRDCTSVYTRKRRLLCLVEATSLTLRSMLPVPVWVFYYISDKTYGDVFVWMYLTFKCIVLSRHTNAMLGSLRLCLQSKTLEFGRPATREEVQEAGAGADCPVCYEALNADNTVVLPCSHFFCETCSSEWLDRERSCPVCRANVQSNFEGWMRMRTGSTSALPCIL